MALAQGKEAVVTRDLNRVCVFRCRFFSIGLASTIALLVLASQVLATTTSSASLSEKSLASLLLQGKGVVDTLELNRVRNTDLLVLALHVLAKAVSFSEKSLSESD